MELRYFTKQIYQSVREFVEDMDVSLIHFVRDKIRPKTKREPIEPLEEDPKLDLSSIPDKVLHLENVRSYLGCKLETLSDSDFNKEYEKIYNQDMSLRVGFEHLKDNEIIRYSLQYEFDDEECTKIILSRIHNGKFWLDDRVIDITTYLIHEVNSLSKSGVILFNEKNVKKTVLDNTKSSYNGKGIVISKIQQDDVRYLCKILTSKFCANSREDDMATGMIHVAYLMCVDKIQVDMCEILRIQLFENLEKIKKTKNSQFRFSSLITYMFFDLIRRFPFTIGDDWNDGKTTMERINQVYMRHLIDKVNESVVLVIKTFQSLMKNRSRIPQSIVEKYKNEICFMVDTDFTYIEAVEPRVEFIDPLGYEIFETEVEEYMNRFLKRKLDIHNNIFGTFEEKFYSTKSIQEEKQSKKRVESTIKKILKDT